MQTPTDKLALEKLTLALPAVAVTVPPQVLVTPGVNATNKFDGKLSVKLASTAITLGLFMLKVSVLEAFRVTDVGTKLLVIRSGSRTTMFAVTVAWSTVAAALPFPLVLPALNVAVAVGTGLPSVSGCAWGMLPSTATSNVTGRPTICPRFPLSVVPLPWLSLLMSAVSVVLPSILIVLGLAV